MGLFTFKRIQLLAFVIAVCSIVSVLVILFFFNYPALARARIIETMVFKNGTESMDRFMTTSELKNLRLSFYVYNVTNPNDVIYSNAKINLQEIGPFVYNEYKYKELIDNNQDSGLISYKLRRRYTFDKDLSVFDPKETNITWINVPLIVAIQFLDNLPPLQKQAAYLIINRAIDNKKETAFITDSAENFLFQGSTRQLFKYLESLDVFKLINPWPLKDNKFALLYGKNDSWNPATDFIMTTSAGFGSQQTYQNLNQYVYINGSARLPFWRQQPLGCNTLGGTDGEFFSPFLDPSSQELEVYSVDICRKLKFRMKSPSIFNGIRVFKYTLDERSLQSGQKSPENQCYCIAGDTSTECLNDGLIDLSTCAFPNVFASGAHFFAGTPGLLERFTGLTPPNETLHEPTIFVEPNTGLSLKAKVPIQFNVRLAKSQFRIFKFFNDSESLILPLLYASESSEATEDQSSLLRSKLLLLDSWFVSMVLCGTIVFIIVIFVMANILFLKCRGSRQMTAGQPATEHEPLLISSNPQHDESFDSTRSVTNQPTNYQTL